MLEAKATALAAALNRVSLRGDFRRYDWRKFDLAVVGRTYFGPALPRSTEGATVIKQLLRILTNYCR